MSGREYVLAGIAILVVALGVLNLSRMAIFLLSADIYSLRQRVRKRGRSTFLPTVSVVIPAHNEGKNIAACVASIVGNDYPRERLEVIVVDDGSTDNTAAVVRAYVPATPGPRVTLVSQANAGKAHALNNGMRNHATGEFVMCLDADSYLAADAITNAVAYFEDARVMALAANVRITRRGGLLNLVQVLEYIVCYQMKKAQTVLNVEYIIGGIGSMFRRAHLERIGYYDTNTVTEDIDITMKILRAGNKVVRVIYGADVIAYTEDPLHIADLIAQRFRWKWGRCQTFLKNRAMFFSWERKYTRGLVWVYLPFALLFELTFLLEPIVLAFILYIVVAYRDYVTLGSAIAVISFYMSMNILADETLPRAEKLRLVALTPLMYFAFYIIGFVEYVALIKTLLNIHTLRGSLAKSAQPWTSVKRLGQGQAPAVPMQPTTAISTPSQRDYAPMHPMAVGHLVLRAPELASGSVAGVAPRVKGTRLRAAEREDAPKPSYNSS